MKEIGVVDMRRRQINILDAIAKYCDDNGLRYYLCAGTLLGAVRHKGYIPWDDDIDIMMLRSDYEVLLRDFVHPQVELFHHESHQGYYYPFAKASDRSSSLVETNLPPIAGMGVNIDIFPLDIIPDDGAKQRAIYSRKGLYEAMLFLYLDYFSSTNRVRLLFEKRHRRLLFKAIMRGIFSVKRLLQRLNHMSSSNGTNAPTDKVAKIIWGYGIREIYRREVFEDVAKVEFEGKFYNAPVLYDEYLTTLFGDYMTPPSADKQVTHHNFVAYEL